MSDILDFNCTNSLAWEQLEYGAYGLKNLHYGLIHNGLSTCVDTKDAILPVIKQNCMPKNYTECQNGDVAFADASEDTNDVAKCVEFIDCHADKVVCGLHTIHGRDKGDKTVVGFKGYAFSSQAFRHQIRRLAQGTKIYSISCKNFSECCIGIPSKEEQSKIARLLHLIDQRLKTQKKIIEDLKKLKDAIAEKLFCSPDNETPELRIANSSVCWNLYRLKDVCQRISERNSQESSSLVLTIAAQYGLVSQTDFFNKSVASENLSNYYLIQKGDFAYNKSYSGEYPWGAVKRLELYEKGVLSPLYICFRPNPLIVNSDFLSHYFETHKWHNGIAQIAGEGARNHGLLNVSLSDYFATLHRLPGLPEQKEIASYLNLLSDKISLANKELQCYSRQKQYLLARMFI